MARLMLDVQGKQHRWTFIFEGDGRLLADWRADGLEVYEVQYSVPAWAVNAGLLKVWIWLTDLKRLVWR